MSPLEGRETIQKDGFLGTLKDAALSARSDFPVDVQGSS